MAADLDAMARRVIDGNHYMTLGTQAAADGQIRLSPVYFTAARHTDFYWLSSPEAHHSRNVEEHPAVELVMYDSTARVGEAEAVYVAATARRIADDELDDVIGEAFHARAGAGAFTAEDLRDDAELRLYVAHALRWDVHVPGRHPVHGTGLDRRVPADPTRG